jgi:DNA integrity scanning protein DisA with diadenylate cyclase activity
MTEMYGFGSHKIDEPQRGETILFNLAWDIEDLKLEERNINNWQEILKLHVGVNADLSHDIVRGTNIEYNIFNTILELCKKISLYGIEGRRVGTAFIIGGETEKILTNFTEQIAWNPFGNGIEHLGSSPERRNIANKDIKDGIIAFSQLDGVFIISNEGVVEAAGRRIKNIPDATDITLPGKGTRHHSVRILTSKTSAIGIVVSQSGPITIFKNGKNCGELRNINDYISPDP